jgi:hypothetical protein
MPFHSKQNEKATSFSLTGFKRVIGRDDWIRTSDLTHPKGARYQASLRPDRLEMICRSLGA